MALQENGCEQVQEFAYEDLNEELVIIYAELMEVHAIYGYLASKSFEQIGIARSQLRALAVVNLTRLMDMPRVVTGSLVSMTRRGGCYDASFLLSNDFWVNQPKVEGDIIVAVPAHDMLMFTGSLNEPGLNKLRELAAKYANKFPGSITDRIFVYRNGQFALFE